MATGYRIDSSVKKREIDEKLKNVESLVDHFSTANLLSVLFSQKLSCDLLSPFDLGRFVGPFKMVYLP